MKAMSLGRHRPRRIPISITSLVDVVFILLLFFMLSSSFQDWNAMTLHSAVGSTSVQPTVAKTTQLVVLHENGEVSLYSEMGQRRLSVAEQLVQLDNQHPLVLFPTASVSLQMLVSHIEQLQAAGFAQVSLGQTLPAEVLP